ncbi:class II fructose-1,6-bisphosphate aldolase [Metamycoplasma hyosynoviae]|uniref:Class II fructose-1,6-bisphosphate aldolase n=1 Tax=Metamycoplasma hyosynoviae TaxID=29559 RepID=A0AAP4EMB8_9BACT|nr:class II fructose-1,6-bisphosphate aldolase [Metamycoplasma hyosynoviae]MDD1372771.1 class II fructose-1,6-bisphosphate aldolase [Metamycoplasma hyosynoviae]MDD7896088.1 class II fructose-1,6-bisphosphate aldolase [Metamycoplasma hyosynoviae]MDI3047767.1 class II fructose-1,6-bisphosphate aldolase [Metamycoplasma hyosynoviae]MDI3102668.1 class II fructose-1,6-bisphosphate aldolase [Metamycoplasma hyosynoviae]MDI3117865.1 class II fructose-1,6-bisphosphate aldolase [Metamycoplasma hyosynovia
MTKNNLINIKKILHTAYLQKYAVPHININNLEWAKTILESAEECKSPVILAASSSAIKYMGGYNIVFHLVTSLIDDLNITVPVALHLDHGKFEDCKKAIDANFSSVMYDGSNEKFEVNYLNSQKIIELASKKNISVEVEIGQIGGEEDGISSEGSISDPKEAKKMAQLDISCLAIGIGNIHGPYPQNWKGINFEVLKKINEEVKLPLVLHGGSGIPEAQIKKAIANGIAKININTELQIANAKALKAYFETNEFMENKNYDPRKIYKFSCAEMKKVIIEKIKLFGSYGKASKNKN